MILASRILCPYGSAVSLGTRLGRLPFYKDPSPVDTSMHHPTWVRTVDSEAVSLFKFLICSVIQNTVKSPML